MKTKPLYYRFKVEVLSQDGVTWIHRRDEIIEQGHPIAHAGVIVYRYGTLVEQGVRVTFLGTQFGDKYGADVVPQSPFTLEWRRESSPDKLSRFGHKAIQIMEADEDWGADTMQALATLAIDMDLARVSGSDSKFKAKV